jgi:hypothetical protein
LGHLDPAIPEAARPGTPVEWSESVEEYDYDLGMPAQAMLPPEVLVIAIPAIVGPLAQRIVDQAIDWVIRRARSMRTRHTVKIYGPDGKAIGTVIVSPTGSVSGRGLRAS